jgi:hypothetical protein
MKTMTYQEFSDLCSVALHLMQNEEDLKKLKTDRNKLSLQRMLGFFEKTEEYEACQDIQEIAIEIFGHTLSPVDIHIIYETESEV